MCDYLPQSRVGGRSERRKLPGFVGFFALSAKRNDYSPCLRLMALNNTLERRCKKNPAFMEIIMGPDATFEHNYIQIVDK